MKVEIAIATARTTAIVQAANCGESSRILLVGGIASACWRVAIKKLKMVHFPTTIQFLPR